MAYIDANLSPARWQWEVNAAPSQAANCGPTCVTKQAQFYRDTWYGIEATRNLVVADNYRGTSATEQSRMLNIRGVAASVFSINSLAQLHSLTDTGRRPVLIGLYMARVPLSYADHPFRGWHAICVSRGAIGGFWVNDPNFSPPGGIRTDPDRGRKFYPDWVMQQALINNYPRFAVVPTYLKAVSAPAPTPSTTRGRGHIATPSGLNVCNIRLTASTSGAIYARARSDGYTYRVSDGARLWSNGSQFYFWGWNGSTHEWANVTTGSGKRLFIHRSVFIVDRALSASRSDGDEMPMTLEPEHAAAEAFDLSDLEPADPDEAANFIHDEPVPDLDEQEGMARAMAAAIAEEGEQMLGREMFRPGQKAPYSGLYVGTKGGIEIALSREDRFPPTLNDAEAWVLVRSTAVHTLDG